MVRLWGPLAGSFLGQMEENTAITGHRGKKGQWSGGCKQHLKYSCWGCTPCAFPPLWAAARKTLLLLSTNHTHLKPLMLKVKEKTPQTKPQRRPPWLVVFPAWTSPSSDMNLRAAASLAPPRWAGVTAVGFPSHNPDTYLNHTRKGFSSQS